MDPHKIPNAVIWIFLKEWPNGWVINAATLMYCLVVERLMFSTSPPSFQLLFDPFWCISPFPKTSLVYMLWENEHTSMRKKNIWYWKWKFLGAFVGILCLCFCTKSILFFGFDGSFDTVDLACILSFMEFQKTLSSGVPKNKKA